MRTFGVGILLLFTFPGLLSRAQAEPYSVQEGDSLGTIALRLYGDAGQWRKIAKENHLSPPYRLRTGQKLNVKLETLPSEAGKEKVVSFWREVLGRRSPEEEENVADEAPSASDEKQPSPSDGEECNVSSAALADSEETETSEAETVTPEVFEDWPVLPNYFALSLGYSTIDFSQIDYFPRTDRYYTVGGEISLQVFDSYRVGGSLALTPFRSGSSTPNFGNQYLDLDLFVSAPWAVEPFGVLVNLVPSIGGVYLTTLVNDALFGYRNVMGLSGGLDIETKLSRRHYPHVGARLVMLSPFSFSEWNYLWKGNLGWRVRLNGRFSVDASVEYSKLSHPHLQFDRRVIQANLKLIVGF
jgi:hypothetical protein